MPQVSDNFGPLYQSLVLDGSGGGSVSFQAVGSNVRLTNITFFVSTVVRQAQVAVYKGQVAPGNRIFNSNSGSTGASATGNVDLFDGETCFVVWTGGDAGATATATFVGGKIPFGEIRPSALVSQEPVAAGDGSLIFPALKSPDFVAGVTGWQLSRDGDAELNDVTVRGDLIVQGPPPTGGYVFIHTDGVVPSINLMPINEEIDEFPASIYAANAVPGTSYQGGLYLESPYASGHSKVQMAMIGRAADDSAASQFRIVDNFGNQLSAFIYGNLTLTGNQGDLKVEGTYRYPSAYGAFTGNIGTGAVTSLTPTSMLANNHGIWVSGSTWTAPVTGTYELGCMFRYATNVVGQRQARIEKNGADLTYQIFDASTAGVTGTNVGVSCITRENLNAGDTVTFRTFQNSGGNLAINYGRMWVVRVQV